MNSSGTFLDLQGPPFTVQQGQTYALALLAPSSLSPTDVTNWLSGGVAGSAPSSSVTTANAWSVTSLHPGSVSGAFQGYTAIATWNGTSGTVLGSATPGATSAPEYVSMAVWSGAPSTAPTTTSTPPTLTRTGKALFAGLGALLGGVLGHFAYHAFSPAPKPAPRLRGSRPNPLTSEEGGSEVQTLILNKDEFPTASSARSWLRSHGYKAGLDEKPNTWRARQLPPGSFKRMRTIRFRPGVEAVVGWR